MSYKVNHKPSIRISVGRVVKEGASIWRVRYMTKTIRTTDGLCVPGVGEGVSKGINSFEGMRLQLSSGWRCRTQSGEDEEGSDGDESNLGRERCERRNHRLKASQANFTVLQSKLCLFSCVCYIILQMLINGKFLFPLPAENVKNLLNWIAYFQVAFFSVLLKLIKRKASTCNIKFFTTICYMYLA